MSDSKTNLLTAVGQESRGGPLSRTFLVARVIAISAALAGAIPTGMNVYHSWKHNIPFTEVSYRLAQAELWSRNFDCRVDYRALTTTGGTRIDVGACQKNGDISLKISTTSGQSTYEWIAFDRLQKPATRAASLLGLISVAEAAEMKPTAAHAPAPANGVQLAQAQPPAAAQAGMQVVCTARIAASRMIRVVSEAGKCYRETFSAIAGKVEKREDVPCNTQCPKG